MGAPSVNSHAAQSILYHESNICTSISDLYRNVVVVVVSCTRVLNFFCVHLINMKSCTLPAGTYYIGDPCYMLDPRVCRECYTKYSDELGGVLKFRMSNNNAWCAMFTTAIGDGCYDIGGKQLTVDSGMLSLIPTTVADFGKNPDYRRLVYRCVFKQPIHLTVLERGYVRLMSNPFITIDTR